jgi:predicted metal-dependent hydrolase
MTRRKTDQRKAILATRKVAYTVTVSPKAAKARIRVGPGGVEVIVPRSAGADRAAEFLVEQSAWVLRQLDRVESMGTIRRAPAEPEPGTILLGGERVPVRVTTAETNRPFALVRRDDTGLTVTAPKGAKTDATGAVERWLRREARRVIEDRVAIWSKALKRTPNRLFIRAQRTKWGNCSKLRNLSFNWRLVMAPRDTLDAIVIHELAHLIEPTHEPRFWLLVRSHCPDYDARMRWLETNKSALFSVSDTGGGLQLPPSASGHYDVQRG